MKALHRTNTGEENETDLFKMRAKLFRFEKATSEWKERGTGDLKLLRKHLAYFTYGINILKPYVGHKESNKIRLVMRRDKAILPSFALSQVAANLL